MSRLMISKLLPIFITVYFIILCASYALITPAFEAPDEASHFVYANYLIEQEAFPLIPANGREGLLSAHHPPLYYLTVALPMQFTNRDYYRDYLLLNPFGVSGSFSYNNNNILMHGFVLDQTLIAVTIGRIVSILLAVATLWLIYATATLVIDDKIFPAIVMLCVASIPTFIFISSSMNNDNLATLIYTAGVYFSARVWAQRRLHKLDGILLGLIVGGSALTKLNIALIVIVISGVLIIGALQKRFTITAVSRTLVIGAILSIMLGGWWYIRNWITYGDLFALDATLAVWGRGQTLNSAGQFWAELQGVWSSFWFTLGSLSIRTGDWFYDYVAIFTIIGVIGLVVEIIREKQRRGLILILIFSLLIVVFTFIISTRQINVSQGRILFPALIAIGILLMLGYRRLLGRYAYFLPLIPLIVSAIAAPFYELQNAFHYPQVVEAIPSEARQVNVQADGIELLAYDFSPTLINPNMIVDVMLYVRGSHPDNPALFIKLLDPVTLVPVGGVDTYPNMMFWTDFNPETIYRIQTRFQIDDARITGYGSRQFLLTFGLRDVNVDDLDQIETFTLEDTNGSTMQQVIGEGPVLLNRDFSSSVTSQQLGIHFGNVIRLNGYNLSETVISSGDSITLTTGWQAIDQPMIDWVIGLGLLNDAGELVAQVDREPAYLSTMDWTTGLQHDDQRTVMIPDDLPAGEYTLYLTLYNRSDLTRLPVTSSTGDSLGDIWQLPETIIIIPSD